MTTLPEEALAKLRQLQEIAVGDVWWLPADCARYPGGKDRYCLIAAVEYASDGKTQLRIHFVCGSSKPGGGPRLVLSPGECGIWAGTNFRFFHSETIDPVVLREKGRLAGRLEAVRLPELKNAINRSRRVALKRLTYD
jgi:hypothetical protein